ncbi:MAG: hypothetical protein ACI9DJ_002584 [Algoriphagus sp.]|jgi:hypothetical protein
MKKLIYLVTLSFLILSCSKERGSKLPNTLSQQEKTDGWKLLFNGESTSGWHLYNKGEVSSAWIVIDGTLYCKPDTFTVEHGDLVSNETYRDYELKFDWNISKAGNSGVFVNVMEAKENPTAWTSGPEYQILDNAGVTAKYLEDSTRWAACLYGFQKIKNTVTPKPSGSWNHSSIIQKDGKITFWLNGVLTAEEDFNGIIWKNLVANSNFKTFSNFGSYTSGHIALQDWSKGVSFRNIMIKEL